MSDSDSAAELIRLTEKISLGGRYAIDALDGICSFRPAEVRKIANRLTGACVNANPAIRMAAIRTLRHAGENGRSTVYLGLLVNRMRKDSVAKIRIAAAWYVTEIISYDSANPLDENVLKLFEEIKGGLKDENDDVVCRVVDALGFCVTKGAELLPIFGRMAGHGRSDVRLRAIAGLRRCCAGIPRCDEVFEIRLRYEQDEEVRAALKAALEYVRGHKEIKETGR